MRTCGATKLTPSITLPLNEDAYLHFMVNQANAWIVAARGTLDAPGGATASLPVQALTSGR